MKEASFMSVLLGSMVVKQMISFFNRGCPTEYYWRSDLQIIFGCFSTSIV